MIRTGCSDREDITGHAAGYQVAEPGPAMRAQHDEARVLVLRGVDDGLPGRSSLDRQPLCPEPGGVGQCCSTGGGLLGGLPHFVATRGVEVRIWLRTEPDAERSPDGEDNGITSARQLMAGLDDGGFGQVGAIVGKQHGSNLLGAVVDWAPARAARCRI
jgi:hypothetical protein